MDPDDKWGIFYLLPFCQLRDSINDDCGCDIFIRGDKKNLKKINGKM